MTPLTPQEEALMHELRKVAGAGHIVTARQLRDAGSAEKAASIYNSDAAYPGSLLSRKLQILRDKGHIEMRNGTYIIL